MIHRLYSSRRTVQWYCAAALLFSAASAQNPYPTTSSALDTPAASNTEQDESQLTIARIEVSGNIFTPTEMVINRLAYQVGHQFDPNLSEQSIKNIYELGAFSQVILEGELLSDTQMCLHVNLVERKLLQGVSFEGNKKFNAKDLKTKSGLNNLKYIDDEVLQTYVQAVERVHQEDSFHGVKVEGHLIPDEENPNKVCAHFVVHQGPVVTVSRVHFIGNNCIPSRKLSKIIFTREHWLLAFMDSAGTYNEEHFGMDKHRIEYFYRDHGYLTAKVYRTEVQHSADRSKMEVTFYINEGKQYTVRSINPPQDEIFTAEELRNCIPLELCKPYSQAKVAESLSKLRDMWGKCGYIYADVSPQIIPDEESSCVDVSFHVNRGQKLYINRIDITGNHKTRDRIIRRELEVCEGDLITTDKLTRSKNNVEYLSFFERDGGVDWHIHRLSDGLADLQLHVQEAKTRSLNGQLSYGTDKFTSRPSLRGAISFDALNIHGLGYDVGMMAQASLHHLQKLEARFFDPHVFDTDISAGFTVYKRVDEFEQWQTVSPSPVQKVVGAEAKVGMILSQIDNRLRLLIDVGLENIDNNNPKPRSSLPEPMQALMKPIVERSFQKGFQSWIAVDLVKDTRNHQIYPYMGYKLSWCNKIALPFLNRKFSFYKTEFEASHYTSLIDREFLVLGLHGRAGHVSRLKAHTQVPYKELFHMGGQGTVRGFVFGGIGPAWGMTGDPLGAKSALQFNAELTFPVMPDYSIRGRFFYDAGAGWDTPKEDLSLAAQKNIRRDTFDMRHAVGFGISLTSPMPAKIDWGFKLDRRKKLGESAHEFHLHMNYAW